MSRVQVLRTALWSLLLFGVSACLGTSTQPPARGTTTSGGSLPENLQLEQVGLDPPPPIPLNLQSQELPPPENKDPDERLRLGVVLSVTVTGEPALSVSRVRVDRDGSLFLPFLGRLSGAGLTPQQLSRAIERSLQERDYLKNPQVHVEVLERSGRRAYVLGRVGRPGSYDLPFHQHVTLTQIIAMAGGLATAKIDLEADPSAIRLLRTGEDGKRRTYRLSFLDVVSHGDLSGDVVIHDQDVIYVPPKLELFIFGSVHQPGGFALADRSRLGIDEALGLAGGFTENADQEGILLIRRGKDGARTYGIPADPVARAEIMVTPNDTIIVPGRSVRRVYVLGSVGAQGGIPLDEPDLTVTKVLALAGGLNRIAAGNSVLLIRRGSDGKKRVYQVPVAEIISSGDGLERDPVVQPGDIIWVPEGFF